jgi:hypothetical protein
MARKKKTKSTTNGHKKPFAKPAIRPAANAKPKPKIKALASRATVDNDSDAPDPVFAPVAAAFARDASVSAGRLMASYGLRVDGKIFAMSWRGRLVAKLPRARVDALVDSGNGDRFDPGHGRLMKEWISVAEGDEDWLALAREAYAFVKAGAPRGGPKS